MQKFSISRKGYTQTEVDSHINKMQLEFERSLAEQKERIFDLKAQLAHAEEIILKAQKQEAIISKAILAAVNKAQEIENVARKKYEMELEQLKAFHSKWQSYYDEIIRRYPLDEEIIAMRSLNGNISKVLKKADAEIKKEDIEQIYEDESSRLNNNRGGINLDALSRVMQNDEDEEKFESMVRRVSGKGGFEPVKQIQEYLENQPPLEQKSQIEKMQPRATAQAQTSERADNIAEGFDYQAAQNPTESLEEIMKELGLMDEL